MRVREETLRILEAHGDLAVERLRCDAMARSGGNPVEYFADPCGNITAVVTTGRGMRLEYSTRSIISAVP